MQKIILDQNSKGNHNEARTLLYQINILLLETSNTELITKVELLNAKLLISNEQIPEAKKQFLQIIKTHPHNIDAMLEYVELCDNTPEPDDQLNRIENLARDLDGDHPHLLLIDLQENIKNRKL